MDSTTPGVDYSVMDTSDPEVTTNCLVKGGPDVGPFYCRLGGWLTADRYTSDGSVYIGVPELLRLAEDLSGIRPGDDFAFVSVVAHEVGHHVEAQLMGDRAFIGDLAVSPTSATWMELGADCLAGVFAKAAYSGEAGQLDATDLEEAVTLWYGFGNDLPFDQSQDPHGTHQQRVDALMLGYDSGSSETCLSHQWPTS